MAGDFLTDVQSAGYGRFGGVPSRSDLERFFFLDDADKALIKDRRGDHTRLGFVLQATTVRYLGVFLEDALDVSWPVVEYLAGQLGIDCQNLRRIRQARGLWVGADTILRDLRKPTERMPGRAYFFVAASRTISARCEPDLT